jgi:hypothetical protein
MPGVDAQTGRALGGFPHVIQTVGFIFSTPRGSRVRRRSLGTFVPNLFGQSLNEQTIQSYRIAVCCGITLYEKRLLIVRTQILRADNTPEKLRAGEFAFGIKALYRPRALLGDYTVEPGERTIYIGQGASDGVLVI